MHTYFRPQRRDPGTHLMRLSVAALIVLGGIAPTVPANAGPDDGRIVATKGHVDAPKAFWENGTFHLKNNSNPYKTGQDAYDLEKTVNWVGKGWDGRNGTSQYTFTNDGSPSLKFLGEGGKTLYMAPVLTRGNQDPIWAGLGADSDIPTEQFRDGVFVTDIISVDGPGRMELFNYFPDGAPADVNRILSSKDPGWHSYLLSKGSHTHNITTFSRPGRYVVTYRTVARSTDGTIIESAPQKLSWQVGGKSPIMGDGTPNAVPTEERYNAANVGDLDAAKYVLSVAPHQLDENPDNNKDADDKLSDITFTAADKNLKGKLTLYNNGYFLTDLDVENGTASWSEMMGSESSQLQAVFTPDGDTGARWISHPLTYEQGKANSVKSDDGNGEWPQKIQDENNTTLNTGTYVPVSGDYTASVKPAEQDGYQVVEVQFKDPKFRGFLRGGLYSKDDLINPELGFESNIDNGVARFYIEDGYDGDVLNLKILPHPDMEATASDLKLAESYTSGKEYAGKGSLNITADAPADPAPAEPTPNPEPSNPAPSTSEPSSPAPSVSAMPSASASASASTSEPAPSIPAPQQTCKADTIGDRRIINDGHLDIQATLEGNQLHLGLKDDSGIIDKKSTVRPLDSVVLTVSDRARRSRTARMSDPALDFIGPVGTAFYGLPQTQMKGLPWPGYSTENIDYSKLSGGVKLHIEPRVMPNGARFGLFTESLRGADVLLDSTKGVDTIDVDYATHAHANWVFTEPGMYGFDVYYTATLADGTEVKTPVQRMQIAVGHEASSPCAPEADKPSTDKPGDDKPSTDAPSQSGPAQTEPSQNEPGGSAQPSPSATASTTLDGADSNGEASNGAAAGGNSGGSDGSGNSGAGGAVSGTQNGAFAADSAGEASGAGGSYGSVASGSAGGSSSSGTLAYTGFTAAKVALAGAVLLIGGVALVVRRRKAKSC